MKSIVRCLKEKHLLLEENINILNNLSGPSKQIVKRQVAKSRQRLAKVYSPELRKFALTLHYYSPRAYNFVRESFNTCLPHPKTLSRWYKTVNGNPGFTEESFHAIRQMVEKSNYELFGALLVDEVAIRKHLDYDGHNMTGYVDLGTGLEGDDRPLAKEALVFMVVSINSSWKIPVGYFLVDGVNSEQRCNLLKQCLSHICETGLRILTLTFDGLSSNLTMATLMGCQLNVSKDLKTFFPHPVTYNNAYIYIYIQIPVT
jgi:hypothetical protein